MRGVLLGSTPVEGVPRSKFHSLKVRFGEAPETDGRDAHAPQSGTINDSIESRIRDSIELTRAGSGILVSKVAGRICDDAWI
ncbi:MAG: hypothetical protein QOH39_2576 [Verrucomicrobiota bacterium]